MNEPEILKLLFSMQKENIAVFKKPFNFNFSIEELEIIYNATKNQNIINATYNKKLREIKPYGVIYLDKIYLIGKEDKKGNDFYTYNVSKISDLKITDKVFKKEEFDIEKFADYSFGIYRGEKYKVELLFKKEAKEKALNKFFHPTQKFEINEDGSVLLTFEASGDVEILREIYKWGNDCKILSPKNLIEKYKKSLFEIIDIYN